VAKLRRNQDANCQAVKDQGHSTVTLYRLCNDVLQLTARVKKK